MSDSAQCTKSNLLFGKRNVKGGSKNSLDAP